ncbi:MAG: hypothetical protein ACRCSP_01360 [Rhodoglobus sp.]
MSRVVMASMTTAVIALALVGCSAGGGSGEKLDANKSPLAEYISALYGDFLDEEKQKEQQKKIEEKVAGCMADQGFDYIPAPQANGSVIIDMNDAERETKKWVSEHGYDITTGATIEPTEEPITDPNQSYVESLSATEQSSYYEALYGVQPTEEEVSSGDYEYNWETAGCSGAARHEAQGPQAFEDKKYQPLFEKMNALYEKAQKDPAIVALDSTWASCMTEAGYSSFDKKQDAMDSVMEKSNALYENPEQQLDEKKLAELQKEEIMIALADFDCSKKINYKNTTLKVQFDLEKQFIADNKAELDAMIAEYEQAG